MALTRPTIRNLNTNNVVFNDSLTVTNFANVANRDIGTILDRSVGGGTNVSIIWKESLSSFVMGYTSATGSETGNITVTANADLRAGNVYIESLNWANGTPFSGGGLPGPGATNQFQYNNAGAFGGATNFLYSANGQVLANGSISSTNYSTGTVVVVGGVGISENLNIGGDARILGNLTVDGNVNTINSNVITINDKNITLANNQSTSAGIDGAGLEIGSPTVTYWTYSDALKGWNTANNMAVGGTISVGANATVNGLAVNNSGTFGTTLSAAAGIQSTPIGNVSASTGQFTDLGATGNLVVGGSATVNSLTSNGAISGTSGTFTSLDSSGNATVNGLTVNNSITAGTTLSALAGIQNTAIGNVTSASGRFTTVNAATIGNTGANLVGTLGTNAQPNITSVGTLTGLTLSGTLTGTTINAATIGNTGTQLTGTLQTAAQPNITSVGTLTSLIVGGQIDANVIQANVFGNAGASFTGAWFTATSSFNGPLNGTLGSAGGNTAIVSTLTATSNATVDGLTVNNSATIGTTLGVTGNATVGNVITSGVFYPNGAPFSPGAGGSDTQLQYNNGGGFGGITGFTYSGGTLTATQGFQNTPIGNATPNTGNFTTVGATGNVTASALTINNSGTFGTTLSAAGGLQNTIIGNVTPNSANFTTLGATGNATVSGLAVNNTATIGSTLSVSGNLNALSNINLTGNIIPSANVTYSLGDSTHRFKDLWLSGSTIYFDNNAFIGTDAAGNIVLSSIASIPGTVTAGNLIANGALSVGTTINSGGNLTAAGGIQNTVIGNVTPSSANFTTLGSTGNATVNALSVNNTATIGSTLGVTGNINGSSLSLSGSATVGTTLGVTGNVNGSSLSLTGSATVGTTLGVTGEVTTSGNVFAKRFNSTSTELSAPVVGSDAGYRLTVYDFNSPTAVNYGIGAEGGHVWFAVDSYADTDGFNFYGNVNKVATISGIGNFTTIGDVTANNIIANSEIITGALSINGNATVNALTVNTSAVVNGTLSAAAGLQNTAIGNITPSTANFTTLGATGNATVNALTVNNSATIGSTLDVTGNLIFGNATTAGTVTISNTTNATGTGTGAFVVMGGASFSKDVYMGANLYVTNLIATSTSNITVQDPLLYLTANTPYPYDYEIGFYSQFQTGVSSGYQHTGLIRNHINNDWYLVSNVGEPSGGTVDLADANIVYDTLRIGGLTASGDINGNGTLNVPGTATVGNLVSNGSITGGSISFANANISGNLTVNGLTVNTSAVIGTTLQAYAGIQNTAIGNVTASTGNFTTVSATGNVTGAALTANGSITAGTTLQADGGLQNTAIGNVTPNSANFTTLGATGNTTVSALTVNTSGTFGTTLSADGGIQNTPIGNVTPNSANFTTLGATGNATISALSINNSATVGGTLGVTGAGIIYGGLQNTVIGNVTPNSANFTTLGATGNVTVDALTTNNSAVIGTTLQAVAGLQNTTIGNVTPSGANFTTLGATGNTTVSALSVNNTATIGNTLGVTGNINGSSLTLTGSATVGTTLGVTGNTTLSNASVTGTLTTNGIIITGGLQDTPIGNATPSTGNFTTLGSTGNTTVNALTVNTSTTVGSTLSATAGIQNTVIGNVTAAEGYFTNINATGNVTAAGMTANGSVTVGSNLGVTGNVVVTGTSTFTGNILGNTTHSGNVIATNFFYPNGQPLSVTAVFTSAYANLQTGDGSTVAFTLPYGNATTAGTIISINGVVQEPINAYSISGGVVTFTEAPMVDDTIDFRVLTLGSSVTSLADTVGTTGVFTDVVVNDKTITLKANNTVVTTVTASGINVKSGGVINDTASITAGTGGNTMDSWSGTSYKAAKYVVVARDSGSTTWTSLEALVVTNGAANAVITSYNTITAGASGTPQVTLTASATGGTVTVTATGAGSGTVVNFTKTYIVGN